MVKSKHKVLSLVLCLTLIVMSVFVGTVNVFAASGDTVYVKANNGWANLYCYMWNSETDRNAAWPGIAMTKVSDGVYSYKLTGDFANIIFNNGSSGNGNQTGDMTYPGHGKIYDLNAGTWSDYSGAPTTDPTTATTPTTPSPTTATTPTPGTGGMTLYFKNTANWSKVNCYLWTDGQGDEKAWPGNAMTSIGDGVWMYTTTKKYVNCIFNNGSGGDGNQTGNLVAKDGYIYDYSTSTWEVYDTSDLRVTSYTADPATGLYPETEVTLNATAANKNGAAVYYRFSVTNAAGGKSVISDFSTANTVTWTPASSGNYTITFDFKDTAGNENSRTLSLTVEDDSTLTKPVIKSVSPANLNLVKVNTATTVSVKAGGGKTGTNLLFYKYIVTDPNGVKNTPYYTLNSTYNFTPKMEGTYTVQVFVQGSDNSTINKTYTYTATTGDIPTTTQPETQPTQPTTQPTQPTTQPTQPATQPTTNVPETKPGVLKGDVNGDGIVNIMDATYIQKYLAGYDDAKYIDMNVADMDGDGKITIVDATSIQVYINTLV